ncbi:MAG: class I SAM-dependent methyltransferase [Streptosporangiaceae bacterium]
MASRAERAQSFGAIAGDYDRLRPPPAEAAVDWLVPPGARVVVDVAAGTGLLTRALARRVPRVIAVEPDGRMRAVLAARSPGVEVRAGRGEAIPLPDASADGVFISSAWHWMDPELALAEITRVLRDGGRMGLIWTSRDRQVGWLRDFGHRRTPGAPPPDEQANGAPGRRPRQVDLPAGVPLVNGVRASFAYTRTMTAADFIELQGTYGGVITASPADRAAELTRARAALEERFPGATEIEVPMRSECWRADRASRPDAGRAAGQGTQDT